jgi:hypothetical protein
METQTELSRYFDIRYFVFNDTILFELKKFKVQSA